MNRRLKYTIASDLFTIEHQDGVTEFTFNDVGKTNFILLPEEADLFMAAIDRLRAAMRRPAAPRLDEGEIVEQGAVAFP